MADYVEPEARHGIQVQAVRKLADAYWRCGGNPEAMADYILATEFADVLPKIRNGPPFEIDGVEYPLIDVVRATICGNACTVAAWIEGHGQTRH